MRRLRAIAGLAAFVLLCGCAAAPGSIVPVEQPASIAPSPSRAPQLPASPTPGPTATKAAIAAPSPSVEIKNGSIATVVTDDLRVRSRPEVSDASKKLRPLLQRGQALYIVNGPVAGSGYRWYQVQPLGGPIDNDSPPFGWVAAGDKTGDPWIQAGGYPCPKTPTTFREFVAIDDHVAALACFGRKPLSFPARVAEPEATCGVDIGWTVEPEWLGSTCSHPAYLVFDATTKDDDFDSIIEPNLDTSGLRPGPEEKDWIPVNVTGSFDHPASSTCRVRVTEGTPPLPSSDEIILSCRARFVITALERLS